MIKAEWTNKDSLDLQPTCNQLATNLQPNGDLISREDVLRMIIVAGECEPDLGYTHLYKVIENLPSAETPTKSTNTPIDTPNDLIQRQDAIDTLNREYTWYDDDDPNAFERIIRLVPSAGQNCILCEYYTEIETDDGIKGKCTRRTGSDLISRQAATTLPVMPKEHREYQTFNLDDAYEQGWDDLQKCIETLPSADTDMSDYCDRLWKIAYERGKADRPTGEWVEEDEYGDLWVCDQCGFASEYRDNFCPNCGSRNVREDGEEE